MAAGDWKDLLDAAQRGDLDLVRYHIKKGVNPNYQHPELLTTPLIESVEFEQIEVAQFLLEHGADASIAAGFSTETALKVAKRKKNKPLIKLLKRYEKKPFWKFWTF